MYYYRHSTSKPLPQLLTGKSSDTRIFGHRGEALASIIELSEKVEIISRAQCADDGDTYCKTFKDGVGKSIYMKLFSRSKCVDHWFE